MTLAIVTANFDSNRSLLAKLTQGTKDVFAKIKQDLQTRIRTSNSLIKETAVKLAHKSGAHDILSP